MQVDDMTELIVYNFRIEKVFQVKMVYLEIVLKTSLFHSQKDRRELVVW